MAFGSPQWMYTSGADFTLDQSLRFDDGSTPYLNWTPSGAGNRKTWTFSAWIKRNNLGVGGVIFGAVGDNSRMRFSTDRIQWEFNNTQTWRLVTTQKFRDPSAWFHLLINVDTTQGTAANRMSMYINGVKVTAFDNEDYPTLNGEGGVNNNSLQSIGRDATNSDNYLDAYLAEVHFIDGTALTPTSFGETGDYGEWKPIEVSGLTYGTNGFYLPFKQDYEVEGFSTITYRGNGVNNATTPRYFGGVGFQPDLIIHKGRSNVGDHRVWDSVRGLAKNISTNTTAAEWSGSPETVTSFDTDGFTLGSVNGDWNLTGRTYVAWNWDMGGSGNTKIMSVADGGVLSTSEKKFGTASLSLDGANRHYTSPQHDDFSFGTGDFTVECWIYQDGSANYDGIVTFQGSSSGNSIGYGIGYNASNRIYWTSNLGAATSVVVHDAALSNSVWHHVAVSRSGGVTKLFIDGTEEDSATDTNNYINIEKSSIGLSVGKYYPTVDEKYFDGYIDEIRISNSARYTSSFSVATSAHTTDANTTLLLHCDGANASTVIKDHSVSTPNTAGSIESDVAANATYGQSIVSYTGNGGSNQTVGHGLSSTPDMVILRNRSDAADWNVGHIGLSTNEICILNTTSAKVNVTTYGGGGLGARGATTFTLADGTSNANNVNASGNTFIAYCFHDVSGYSKFGSYTGTAGTHTVTTGFQPAFVLIKRTDTAGNSWAIFDSTRDPDGAADHYLYADDSVAEGSGTTRLDFISTGFTLQNSAQAWNGSGSTYIYAAFADKREYAYWLDQSGNNNDWTSNNLTESDIMVDSPTNNFATQNPLHIHTDGSPTFSEGNLRIMTALTPAGRNVSTMGFTSGKYYAEMLHEAGVSGSWVAPRTVVGITTNAVDTIRGRDGSNIGTLSSSEDVGYFGDGGSKNIAGTYSSYGSGWTIGDIIGVALNMDDDEVTFYKNNVSQGALSFTAGGEGHFACGDSSAGGGLTAVWNYGQDSSFAGNKTVQGNQDSNSIGDFYYTPPSGFLALCTSNLPAVAVVPSEHFGVHTRTGTGTSTSVTGKPLAPDLVWTKVRNVAGTHVISDNVRGVNKQLFSNLTNAEGTATNKLTAFNSDGYTLGADDGSGTGDSNYNGQTYVDWFWKANGSGSSNTDGTITSTVSANVDAGFSIVSYTGNATNDATIGHGLSKAPDLMIVKSRDGADAGTHQWYVYEGTSASLYLESTEPLHSDNRLKSAQATTFTVSQHAQCNASGDAYIGYMFHSVEGYSKVGHYTGNGGSANNGGVFVYTGFKPAWIIRKITTGSNGSWHITDNKRDGYNGDDSNDVLLADTNAAEVEAGRIDLLSNGFKIRTTDSDVNADGSTYVYMAFAETPLKYATAR